MSNQRKKEVVNTKDPQILVGVKVDTEVVVKAVTEVVEKKVVAVEELQGENNEN
jgi:hypothetical protein